MSASISASYQAENHQFISTPLISRSAWVCCAKVMQAFDWLQQVCKSPWWRSYAAADVNKWWKLVETNFAINTWLCQVISDYRKTRFEYILSSKQTARKCFLQLTLCDGKITKTKSPFYWSKYTAWRRGTIFATAATSFTVACTYTRCNLHIVIQKNIQTFIDLTLVAN